MYVVFKLVMFWVDNVCEDADDDDDDDDEPDNIWCSSSGNLW